MSGAQVEYVGFTTRGAAREYTLRVRQTPGEAPLLFTLVIPTESFAAQRVRFQDGPEICFLKLQRELLACSGGVPEARLTVSDAELADYRTAHAPPQRGPKPAVS